LIFIAIVQRESRVTTRRRTTYWNIVVLARVARSSQLWALLRNPFGNQRYAQHIQGFWIKSCHREIEARFTISVCPLSDITRENIALAMSYAPA